MGKAENRSQMMRKLNAKLANPQWACCAVNEDEKKVYLSVWVDLVEDFERSNRYLLQDPDWGVEESGEVSKQRKDQDEKMRLIFEKEYEVFGYFVEAVDPAADPREIKETRTSFVMRLELSRDDRGCIYGIPVERISLD